MTAFAAGTAGASAGKPPTTVETVTRSNVLRSEAAMNISQDPKGRRLVCDVVGRSMIESSWKVEVASTSGG